MESPDVYQLTRIRWQLFGTLTFASERLPERVRLAMWFAYCRKTAANFRLHFPKLLWCLRQEQGESFGRRHFHYLLGGLPQQAVTISTCMAQKSAWEKFLPCKKGEVPKLNPAWNVGGGMARVRLFDHSRNGVGYVSECLSMGGADVYESAKFGAASSGLMLSKGAQALLARVIREERRRVARLDQSSGIPPGQVQARSGAVGLNQRLRATA